MMVRWVLGLLILLSCSNQSEQSVENQEERDKSKNDEGWTNYKIRAGKHHNEVRSYSLSGTDSLYFSFRFNYTAAYKIDAQEEQKDWNKLIGLSDCNKHHQQNSARWVWRWLDDNLELGIYLYRDGVRFFEKFSEIDTARNYSAFLLKEEGNYLFGLEQKSKSYARPCSNSTVSYLLLPYFGGNTPAPQNVDIFLQLSDN